MCIDAKEVCAKKSHRCYWCGELIDAGSKYAKWFWCDGGIGETIKAHLECRDAWDEMARSEHGEYGAGFGEHSRGCQCEYGLCECGKRKGDVK